MRNVENVLTNQLILFAVVAAGLALGFAIHRLMSAGSGSKNKYADTLPRLTDSFGFVSSAVAILLALLLSISVTTFQNTQASVNDFNSSAISAYHGAEVYPDEYQSSIRNDIICVVEVVYSEDVNSQHQDHAGHVEVGGDVSASNQLESSDAVGATQANLWLTQLNYDLNDLPTDTGPRMATYSRLLGDSLNLGVSRHEMLSYSTQTLPVIVWAVIYILIFIMAILLSLLLADKRRFAVLSTVLSYFTLAGMLFGLSVLQSPLNDEGLGGVVDTQTMSNLVTDITETYPDEVIPQCPILEPGVQFDWD